MFKWLSKTALARNRLVKRKQVVANNLDQLGPYHFICWTQAGFKKACSSLSVGAEEPIEGYPKTYPSVVTFIPEYRGFHYYSAQCIPLNIAIAEAQTYHKHLVKLDIKHRKQLENEKCLSGSQREDSARPRVDSTADTTMHLVRCCAAKQPKRSF